MGTDGENTRRKVFDETVRVLKQAKAIVAMNRMRNKAEQNGFMSDEEINEAIKESLKC